MKLCTFRHGGLEYTGIIEQGEIFPTQFASMIELLTACENNFSVVRKALPAVKLQEIELLACVPKPNSLRDFFAFEAHIQNARKKRGLEVPPEWYQFPAFYFSNHNAIVAPFADVKKPLATQQLDYELELACVIGKSGIDIPRGRAAEYIAGYALMNDWSARDIQMQEIKVGLGPAKGKDFATTLGGILVTADELADKVVSDRLDLEMEVLVNGKKYGGGNFKSVYFSFAEMIERASQSCTLYAGDVIGSGTVGTGCLLELDNDRFPYLNSGDTVEMRIERIGMINNKIV
ncbi:MAG: fumarylacetoacetate hydrolase family protein [Rhizobacter sp.]|nr:fumarylacetoacetate hydrolase family protein [Chlorobiales bacterium]